jgi:hypothetical protein
LSPRLRLGAASSAVAALAVGLLASPAARADAPFVCPEVPTEAAKAERFAHKLFDEAVELEELDPVNALARYRCAQKALERPAIALRIGTVEEHLGHPGEAADAYARYLALAGDQAPEREPLSRHIVALREEAHPARAPSDRRDASGRRTVGVVALGVGAGLVVAGGVLLGLAKVGSDDVHALGQGTTAWTSDEASGAYARARTEQTVGLLGLAVGGVAAAVGLVLVLRGHPVGVSAGPTAHGATTRLSVAF